jgi:hypothetical protein
MAKKKSEIKQNQKQSINITIGDRVVKRKRRRPRKSAGKSAKGSGFFVQHTFTAPIINYPPTYVNPAVVQPIQQPEPVTLVPRAPAGKPPAKQPRTAVFNEGETAPALGVSAVNPNELKFEQAEPSQPISAFSRRLAVASQQAKLEQFTPPKPLGKSKAKPQPTAENALGGRDENLGDQFEPNTGGSTGFGFKYGDPPAGFAYDDRGILQPSEDQSKVNRGVAETLNYFLRPVLPPIRAQTIQEAIAEPFIAGAVNIAREKKPRKQRKPKGIQPPNFPPPEEASPKRGSRKSQGNTPQERQSTLEAVEPLDEPPEEGIRFLGSTPAPAPEPPSIQRQREQAIPPAEQNVFV